MILKQKEIFNKVANERVEEITELYKKVNSDDAICRFKGQTPDGKFDGYDNPFDLLDKIREGRIKLSNARNDHIKFTSDQAEIKKRNKKRSKGKKKTHYTKLKCFAKQETRLFNFLMIILQLYLKLKIKQLEKIMKQPKEKNLRY